VCVCVCVCEVFDLAVRFTQLQCEPCTIRAHPPKALIFNSYS